MIGDSMDSLIEFGPEMAFAGAFLSLVSMIVGGPSHFALEM